MRRVMGLAGAALIALAVAAPVAASAPEREVISFTTEPYIFAECDGYEVIEQLNIHSVIDRYFNAAGASKQFGEHHRIETHLIPNVLKVPLGQSKHCEIFGTDYPTQDGTCIRDYIHVVDLAQAHILAMAPGKKGFYNLGNGDGYSVREVITTCERICERKIPVVEKPRRPGDPPKLVASADRRATTWAGSRNTPGSNKLSARPGNGIKSIRVAMMIDAGV